MRPNGAVSSLITLKSTLTLSLTRSVIFVVPLNTLILFGCQPEDLQ